MIRKFTRDFMKKIVLFSILKFGFTFNSTPNITIQIIVNELMNNLFLEVTDL